MRLTARRPIRMWLLPLLVSTLTAFAPASYAQDGFAQALAQAVAKDKVLAQYYASTGYQPLWTGKGSKFRKRVTAINKTLAQAGAHGLPEAQYQAAALKQQVRGARTVSEKVAAEVALSRAFLAYAEDVQSGILVPSKAARDIYRDAPRRDPVELLAAMGKGSAAGFLSALPPQTNTYKALLEEKTRLERLLGQSASWGPQVPSTLRLGDSGNAVVALSNRLTAKGYGRLTNISTFGPEVDAAVKAYQSDHGLAADGVVGRMTLAEINKDPADRLAAVLVAMERERWLNRPLGKRHIWVNIPDFSTQVVDNGRVTFTSRVVVGKNAKDHRTPEFSDVMEYMVINPTWNVPRSITVKEYLPMLQNDSTAVSHLQLLDNSGNYISRASVDFASYTQDTFPYRLKEPPSNGNALGKVKFMFPNRHNIYLHDTPHKSLFGRSLRAFSHGCIRVHQPFDLAYVLLGAQTGNPQGTFARYLNSGKETTVRLNDPVPVHLVYRTAFPKADGTIQYRSDLYGRDAAVFKSLQKAGVTLRALRS